VVHLVWREEVGIDDEARLTLADDVSTCAPWLADHFGVVTGRF
jgi:hypothetical protein